MDRLLRDHARRERRSAAAPGTKVGACRPEWRILLGARGATEPLRRWWEEHGRGCSACRAAAERVAADDMRAAGVLGIVHSIRLFAPSSTGPAWAAASEAELIDPHAPLPLVRFHRLASGLDTGLDAIWCVGCDESVLLILCGDRESLAPWRQGARVQREDDASTAEFALADTGTSAAFCPEGTFDGRPAICLVCIEPLTALTAAALTLPGLLEGEFRLELLAGTDEAGEREILDLVRRNRVTRFLDSLSVEEPDAGQRETCNFYLRLLLRQRRLPDAERRRLRTVPWLAPDVRTRMESDA